MVLFIHKESAYTAQHTWRLGKVQEILSQSPPIKVLIEYKNVGEKGFRMTERSSRELIPVHRLDELDYNTKEHQEKLSVLAHFSAKTQGAKYPLKLIVATQ